MQTEREHATFQPSTATSTPNCGPSSNETATLANQQPLAGEHAVTTFFYNTTLSVFLVFILYQYLPHRPQIWVLISIPPKRAIHS